MSLLSALWGAGSRQDSGRWEARSQADTALATPLSDLALLVWSFQCGLHGTPHQPAWQPRALHLHLHLLTPEMRQRVFAPWEEAPSAPQQKCSVRKQDW